MCSPGSVNSLRALEELWPYEHFDSFELMNLLVSPLKQPRTFNLWFMLLIRLRVYSILVVLKENGCSLCKWAFASLAMLWRLYCMHFLPQLKQSSHTSSRHGKQPSLVKLHSAHVQITLISLVTLVIVFSRCTSSVYLVALTTYVLCFQVKAYADNFKWKGLPKTEESPSPKNWGKLVILLAGFVSWFNLRRTQCNKAWDLRCRTFSVVKSVIPNELLEYNKGISWLTFFFPFPFFLITVVHL